MDRLTTLFDRVNPKYWVLGLVILWFIVVSIALHPTVGFYILAHLMTTGVFVYAIWRAEQKAHQKRE